MIQSWQNVSNHVDRTFLPDISWYGMGQARDGLVSIWSLAYNPRSSFRGWSTSWHLSGWLPNARAWSKASPAAHGPKLQTAAGSKDWEEWHGPNSRRANDLEKIHVHEMHVWTWVFFPNDFYRKVNGGTLMLGNQDQSILADGRIVISFLLTSLAATD